jgi:3-oxoacyl-[acyl-carrier protein] reductase
MGEALKDKVAVVTGSGQGIGRALAIGLAKEGEKVVNNNRKKGGTRFAILKESEIENYTQEQKDYLKEQIAEFSGDAETVANEIIALGGQAVPFFGDVSKFEVAGQLIQTAIDNYGKIDILVNVAGAFNFASCYEMTEEVWDHVTGNKPKSYFNTIRHAAPYMMKQKWGRIINTTALAFTGMVNHCNYSAANAGVVGLSRAVAKELWQYGVTCNMYSPTAASRASYEVVALLKEREGTGEFTPLPTEAAERFKTFPEAAAIAPLIVWLCTNDAANVSGSIFHVKGGNIGIYTEPVIINSIDKATGFWSLEELKTQMPNLVLKDYKTTADKP